jgi:pimeloyl-ACP methyl ester carboxylesterase
VGEFLDELPPQSHQLPFTDNPDKEVQIVRRDHSDTVILVFCDRRHHLAFSLTAVHRWLGLLPASVVYLRDFQVVSFLKGIPTLGENREATLVALRRIVSSLGAKRVLCIGNSSGAFAALHYALDLEAEAVIALGPPTVLSAQFNADLYWQVLAERIAEHVPEAASLDLRALYAAATHPPRACIAYTEKQWDDRIHAEHMRGLPSVSFEVVEKHDGHYVLLGLIRRKRLPSLLNWLISPASVPVLTASL